MSMLVCRAVAVTEQYFLFTSPTKFFMQNATIGFARGSDVRQ
jgi:hypothetical protein